MTAPRPQFKLTYERYNNKEFSSILSCDSKEEAEKVAEKLKMLRHVTKIIITEVNA
ncbi:MAG: hypothetical protein ACYDG4_13440 [Desulfuromonadaceae bacterium]